MLSFRKAVLMAAALCSASVFAAPPVPVMMAISLDPLPLYPTGAYTVSATVTTQSGGLPVTCGDISFVFKKNNTKILGLVGADSIPLNGSNTSSYGFSAENAPFTLAVGDKLTVQATYVSSGPDCAYGNLTGANSPSADYYVVTPPVAEICPSVTVLVDGVPTQAPRRGVYISVNNATGNHLTPGTSIEAAYEVTVLACEDVTGVTAQGGVNGWATNQTCTAEDGYCELRKQTKNNNVFFWTIGSMAKGDVATNVVDMLGTTKNSPSECGKVRTLNGAWSALFTATSDGLSAKSEYSKDAATMQVYCN